MGLIDVPRVVLSDIFCFLYPEEVAMLGVTCRHMKASIDVHFKSLETLPLTKVPRMNTSTFMGLIRKLSTHLKLLKLDISGLDLRDLRNIPASVTYLKLIGFTPTTLQSPFLTASLSHLTNLATLKLNLHTERILYEVENLDSVLLDISEISGIYPFVDYYTSNIKFCDLKNDENIKRQDLLGVVDNFPVYRLNKKLVYCDLNYHHIKVDSYMLESVLFRYPKIEIYQLLHFHAESQMRNSNANKIILLVTITSKKNLAIFSDTSRCSCEVLDENKLLEFAIVCRRIKDIALRDVHRFQNEYFSKLFTYSPMAKGLKLDNCQVNEQQMIEISTISRLKNLRLVFLRRSPSLDSIFQYTSLQELHIDRAELKFTERSFKLLCSMRFLLKLRLNNASVNDKCMRYIPDLKQLTHLLLNFCKNISSGGHRAIGHLQHLRHLEITGYKTLYSNDINHVLERIARTIDTIVFAKITIGGSDQVLACMSQRCLNLRYLVYPISTQQARRIKNEFKSLVKFKANDNTNVIQ